MLGFLVFELKKKLLSVITAAISAKGSCSFRAISEAESAQAVFCIIKTPNIPTFDKHFNDAIIFLVSRACLHSTFYADRP